MALAYLLDPSFQFVNENGRPLVGGKISVYYHNSHLPYITKADFNGTNNPFEVPLNSKGMAIIIADDSNAYDVFCHDALGTLFWSRENVTIGVGGGGGGGESKLEIFNCTEPDWPNPTEMFDSYNGGKDVVIVRQSFSGVNYSVWNLENVVKDSGLVKNYTLEFQNEEGNTSANHKTNRVSFYSSDYENWTITEKTFYYPERSTIAPNWSSLDVSNYKNGTLVYRAGVLYICKTDTPSSSWIDSEWKETNIASEVEKGELKIFTCTEPDWPAPSLMYSAFESGQDIAIVRQSFSGVIYSVWRLATTIKDVGSPKNYTLEFQNDEGSETANRKTNRVKFYSTDKENWTTTETNFVYPERSTIAPNWSSLDVSNYNIGTLVYRAGVLYRCKTDTPSSSWVASEWEETDIANEVENVLQHRFKTLTYNLIDPSKFTEFVLKVDKDETTGLLLVGFYCKFAYSTPFNFDIVAQVQNLNNTRNTNFTLVNETGNNFAYFQLTANGYVRIMTFTQNVDVGVRYVLVSPGITLDV